MLQSQREIADEPSFVTFESRLEVQAGALYFFGPRLVKQMLGRFIDINQ